MKLTKEQNDILEKVKTSNLLKITAKAGSGKTYISQEIVKQENPKRGLYFAFNKAIVMEGKGKFPSNIECRTIHALALKHAKLNIDNFSYHNIKEDMRYDDKKSIIDSMNKFYSSGSISPKDFFTDYLGDEYLVNITLSYIQKMMKGKIPATFGLVMKYFHILLALGKIKVKYDMIILDEAGDTTEVILEIFKLIDSPKKIMLGDNHQNIYTFTHTVDGFEYFRDIGDTLSLTKSFRVSSEIAEYIQDFAQENIDEDFIFKGVDREIEENSTCYITRTNSELINTMKMLRDDGVDSFNSIRPLDEIFEFSLAMITASSGSKLSPKMYSKYKYLTTEYRKYNKDKDFKGDYFKWLKDSFSKDKEITSTVTLIKSLGSENMFDMKQSFKKLQNSKSNIHLGTAFVTKGLEYDVVHIGNDLNRTITRILDKNKEERTKDDYTELLLYYVATSRARHRLYNRV